MNKKVLVTVSILISSFSMATFAIEDNKSINTKDNLTNIEQNYLYKDFSLEERIAILEKEHAKMIAEKQMELEKIASNYRQYRDYFRGK